MLLSEELNVTSELLDRMHHAARMIEIDGDEARVSVSRIYGGPWSLALVQLHYDDSGAISHSLTPSHNVDEVLKAQRSDGLGAAWGAMAARHKDSIGLELVLLLFVARARRRCGSMKSYPPPTGVAEQANAMLADAAVIPSEFSSS